MIDLIFTTRPDDSACAIVKELKLMVGCISTDSRLKNTGTVIDFVDNDFKNYNHARHLDIIRKIQPKYATVRDLMTPEQCQCDGIEWHSFEQIMTWTAEIAECAENVIVIPKYDCIDAIYDFDRVLSEKIVLGYSVPTRYGGTTVPLDRFRGHRVHLLGGRFDRQMAILNQLGDGVISIDFNQINLIAKKGDYISPDGRRHKLQNNRLGFIQSTRLTCLDISLNAIKARFTISCLPQKELIERGLVY